MKTCDLYWLAGVLEGEGSFMPGPPCSPTLPVISVMMTDEDIISRISKIFEVKYLQIFQKNTRYKITYTVRLRGKRAVEIMKSIKHIMGKRRQEQIERALKSYTGKYYKLNEKVVIKIKEELSKGLSQASVGKKFGISRETINKINTGKKWSSIKI